MTDAAQKLKRLANHFGFSHTWDTDICTSFGYGNSAFPFWITARIEPSGEIGFYGRVRTHGLASCRTDLHDWIGVLWSASLRVLNSASAWVIDEEGFVSEQEIYGRFLSFAQPTLNALSFDSNEEEISRLFAASNAAARMLSHIWCSAKISENDVFDWADDCLPEEFRALTKAAKTRNVIIGKRSECISYHLNCTTHTSVTDLRQCSTWRAIWDSVFEAGIEGQRAETSEAFLVRSGGIRNVVWKRESRLLANLAKKVLGDSEAAMRFVPCESHLFAITPSGLCSRRVNSGNEAYADQFDRLRATHANNAAFLNSDVQFDWAATSNPARFEEFVFQLLANNPHVVRAKKVGHCNEPDGGRDILLDVRRSFLKSERATERDDLTESLRIIVQCKTSLHNVGKSAIKDIRDTVDQHSAHGFLLVAFPGVTKSLLEYVESIRSRALFWIDCWSKSELEAHIRSNPATARQFAEIVQMVAPPNAA